MLGVEAPGWQGARNAHTGRMQATSNAARQDASAASMVQLFLTGSLDAVSGVWRVPPVVGPAGEERSERVTQFAGKRFHCSDSYSTGALPRTPARSSHSAG